jgi:RIO kinase 1
LRDVESYSEHYPEPSRKRRRRRFDDDPPARSRRADHAPDLAALDERLGVDPDGPPAGDRWSTWDGAEHGPHPRPSWVITEHAAVDTDLGVIKTGKEADVHLVERAVPGTERRALMAAKRYRSAEHRMFHRDAGYLEGRRVRRSREMRAMANRTAFGRDILAGQWAGAEFAALSRLWAGGVAVPYPVQCSGTELLQEFVGTDDGTAAPRLAQLRPDEEQLRDLWHQLVAALLGLARHGLTHGDLSAYNLLVHDGRLVLIDLPQVVDVVGNPQGPEYLARDVHRIGEWFGARGLPPEVGRPDTLLEELRAEVGMPRGAGTSHDW